MKVNKNGIKGLFRQGDVLYKKIEGGADLSKLKKTKNATLAFGEVTGHHHTAVHPGAVVGFADNETELPDVLVVNKTTELGHQEHDRLPLKKDAHYDVLRQTEFKRGEIQRVAD